MFTNVFAVNKFAKCIYVTWVVATNDTDFGEIVVAIMLFVEVISGVVSVASVVWVMNKSLFLVATVSAT